MAINAPVDYCIPQNTGDIDNTKENNDINYTDNTEIIENNQDDEFFYL